VIIPKRSSQGWKNYMSRGLILKFFIHGVRAMFKHRYETLSVQRIISIIHCDALYHCGRLKLSKLTPMFLL